MITGAIKNKVDKIWTDIWAGGITNPLTVIEQLTYMMFIRSLDEKELETEEFENMSGEKMDKIFPQSPIGQSMRWSKFKNNDPRDIYDVISQRVFPAIKNMKSRLTMCKARYGASGRRKFRIIISTACCWHSIRSMKQPPKWSGRSSCGRLLSGLSYSRKSSRMATGLGRLSSTSLSR